MAFALEELSLQSFGESLLGLLRQRRADLEQQARRAIDFAKEVTEPPSGAQLITDDGSEYSGIALVQRGNVTALLGVHHEPTRAPPDRAARRSPGLFGADNYGVNDGWDHRNP